jgi:hypothetical protein
MTLILNFTLFQGLYQGCPGATSDFLLDKKCHFPLYYLPLTKQTRCDPTVIKADTLRGFLKCLKRKQWLLRPTEGKPNAANPATSVSRRGWSVSAKGPPAKGIGGVANAVKSEPEAWTGYFF